MQYYVKLYEVLTEATQQFVTIATVLRNKQFNILCWAWQRGRRLLRPKGVRCFRRVPKLNSAFSIIGIERRKQCSVFNPFSGALVSQNPFSRNRLCLLLSFRETGVSLNPVRSCWSPPTDERFTAWVAYSRAQSLYHLILLFTFNSVHSGHACVCACARAC